MTAAQLKTLEDRLCQAADNLRANSNLKFNEYAIWVKSPDDLAFQ